MRTTCSVLSLLFILVTTWLDEVPKVPTLAALLPKAEVECVPGAGPGAIRVRLE